MCGDGRIPYSNSDKMRCVAVGLPPGVSFQQPALYKLSELSLVHSNLESFSFLCVAEGEDNVASVDSGEPSCDS